MNLRRPRAEPNAEVVNSLSIDRQLPAHRPRESQVHRPAAIDDAHGASSNACGFFECLRSSASIGADVSEKLEYVPARFKVIRHVRPKLACVACSSIF